VKYDVDWKPAALAELAAIWNGATDRNDVSAASDEIDRLLERSADQLGESREKDFRVFLLKPLGVEFQVLEAQRQALVVRVWRFRLPRP
jgi:plasmid stabilization system protein ParE